MTPFAHRGLRLPVRHDQLPGNCRLPPALRLPVEEGEAAEPADPLAREPRLAQVEAALFLAEEPLTARKIASAAALSDAGEAKKLLRQLQELYDREGSSFRVEELAGGYQLLTRPEFHPWLARFRRSANAELKLTPALKETLAIIAYRQPIVRADIEAIRGVQCSEVLKQLMEKGLIRIAGRDDSLGRPVLYGTTKKFLQVFGLRSLKDLPQAEQFRQGAPKKAELGEAEPDD